MRRRVLTFIAALGLTAGAVATTGAPAGAHNHSDLSVLFCTTEMLDSNPSMFLAHSWPVYIDSETIIYWCSVYLGVHAWTFYAWVSLSDGTTASSGWCNTAYVGCADMHD